jgi:single-stranded DNA-binding protein
MHLVVSRTPDAPPLRGLRVCVYGYDAVWIQAGVYQGSRIAVMGHIQRRIHEGKNIFEIVAEDVQLLHNVNWEQAMEARKELVDKGYLLPWSETITGLSADVFFANQHLNNDPDFAQGQA